MDAMVIKNLRKEYQEFILDNISFSIPKGYIMGFVGENGAGKTTTIKSILNVVPRDSGTVEIFGKNIDEFELELKQRIGFVSGDVFYPKKKLKDITKIYKRFFKNWDDSIYNGYLAQFNLSESKRIDELSKGMCLKYSLSLALSHQAELLILDEPTSGLDPVARDNLLQIFQGLVEDESVSILYSTHITSDLEKCADYITFIQDGKLLESCSKDNLIDKYRLVNGSKEFLKTIENHLIAYKENAFGFNGLIESKNMIENDNVKYGKPSIDDIIIYFAERKEQK